MTLSEAIDRYIAAKRANGAAFRRSSIALSTFLKSTGEIGLSAAHGKHVLCFLNRVHTSNITWRLKYWTLYRFFEYWSHRDELVQIEMPKPKPFVRQTFVPHIYTRSELRNLLETNLLDRRATLRLGHETLNTLILFLYATGATIGKAVLVRLVDFDLEKGRLTFTSTRASRERTIPIGPDLVTVLQRYLGWRSGVQSDSANLFINRRGSYVSAELISRNFTRLRKVSKVRRRDDGLLQPRVEDLRFTFAVHRIEKWIRAGADLNRMLPALAAYMGQSGLGSTERYLFLTPERFRKDLDELSILHGEGGWRNDPDLIAFLSEL